MTLTYMRSVVKLKEEGSSKLSYFPMCDDSKLLLFTEVIEFFWVEQMPLLILADLISLSLSFFGEGNGNPLQYACLENPLDRGSPRGHKESDMTWWLRHTLLFPSSLLLFLLCMLIPLLFFLFVHLKYIFWSTKIKKLHFHSQWSYAVWFPRKSLEALQTLLFNSDLYNLLHLMSDPKIEIWEYHSLNKYTINQG